VQQGAQRSRQRSARRGPDEAGSSRSCIMAACGVLVGLCPPLCLHLLGAAGPRRQQAARLLALCRCISPGHRGADVGVAEGGGAIAEEGGAGARGACSGVGGGCQCCCCCCCCCCFFCFCFCQRTWAADTSSISCSRGIC
jgi:hypothetical protein